MLKIEHTIPTRSPKQALQVYLDSNDYSDLSKAMHDAAHPDADIFQTLCQLVDQGRIEIRFSAVHVIEMAHLDSGSRQFALSRARCLQRLSGGKCFRFWLEIPVSECINILTNRPVYENITTTDGFWQPDFSQTTSSMKQLLIEEFKALLARISVNRKQRKGLARRYFPNNRLSKEGIRLLQIRREELLATLSEQFPFSDRFFGDDLMLKFTSGTASATEIVEEMSVVFRDIEKFIGWTYDTRDKERKLVSWLRDYGSDLTSKIQTLRADLDEAIRPFLAASDVRKRLSDVLEIKMSEIRTSRLSEIRSEVKRLRPSFRSSDADWANIRDSPLGSIPSLDAHLFSFFEYFRRNLQMIRKPKPSDAGDMFHMVHLPYCDLFRADGDAAEVAKTIAPPFKTLVVPKLRELPIQIDDALKRLAARLGR